MILRQLASEFREQLLSLHSLYDDSGLLLQTSFARAGGLAEPRSIVDDSVNGDGDDGPVTDDVATPAPVLTSSLAASRGCASDNIRKGPHLPQ